MQKMTRDGLVQSNISGEKQERISRRFENEDFSSRSIEIDDDFRMPESKEEGNSGKKKRYRKLSRQMEADSAKGWQEHHEGQLPQNHSSVQLPDNGAVTKPASVMADQEMEEPADGAEQALPHTESVRYSNVSSASSVGQALQDRHEARRKEKTESRLQRKKRQQRLYREMSGDSDTFAEAKDTIARKQKKEQVNQTARKQGRLSFEDEALPGQSMTRGASGKVVSRAAGVVSDTGAVAIHSKVNETEDDNSAVKGAHKAELLAEHTAASAVRQAKVRQESKRSRLRESASDSSELLAENLRSVQAGEKSGAKAARRHALQKSQIKREYQKAAYKAAKSGTSAAASGSKAAETAVGAGRKVKEVVQSFFARNKGLFIPLGILTVLFVTIMAGLGSCSATIAGVGTSIISTTYASTDEEIYAVENAYLALEEALNNQINNMERTHPGYDEYNYQVDEISHNPYHLISYFTAKYGEFTYRQVKDELEEIFRAQYRLAVDSIQDTVTETRTVRVGESLGMVVTSGYCNCRICCGVWSGGPTASGAYPTANHTIAVDANNPFVPMGTKVVMNGVEYTVEDTGNFDRYGVQFDVYYDSHATASAHGHQTWEAFIADSNGNREVEVTSTQEINRLNVTLTNRGLDSVLRSRMTPEEIQRYDLYNLTYGNRDYLFDINSLPSIDGDGFRYEIPPEALSDARFANMIREAEKYLGYPYVWGGSSPSTSFDCSGYVSWVINNCGNGWNVGRMTADGLLRACTIVSQSEAKPGDLIFFQGTYNTSGASHVGIYVGDGMMIHCGSPIQYTSINTNYWQSHFYHFGRLP